jgi:hypothetical protein
MKFDWKILVIAVLVILLIMQIRPVKSGYSDVVVKHENENCPEGYKTLGKLLCGKE